MFSLTEGRRLRPASSNANAASTAQQTHVSNSKVVSQERSSSSTMKKVTGGEQHTKRSHSATPHSMSSRPPLSLNYNTYHTGNSVLGSGKNNTNNKTTAYPDNSTSSTLPSLRDRPQSHQPNSKTGASGGATASTSTFEERKPLFIHSQHAVALQALHHSPSLNMTNKFDRPEGYGLVDWRYREAMLRAGIASTAEEAEKLLDTKGLAKEAVTRYRTSSGKAAPAGPAAVGNVMTASDHHQKSANTKQQHQHERVPLAGQTRGTNSTVNDLRDGANSKPPRLLTPAAFLAFQQKEVAGSSNKNAKATAFVANQRTYDLLTKEINASRKESSVLQIDDEKATIAHPHNRLAPLQSSSTASDHNQHKNLLEKKTDETAGSIEFTDATDHKEEVFRNILNLKPSFLFETSTETAKETIKSRRRRRQQSKRTPFSNADSCSSSASDSSSFARDRQPPSSPSGTASCSSVFNFSHDYEDDSHFTPKSSLTSSSSSSSSSTSSPFADRAKMNKKQKKNQRGSMESRRERATASVRVKSQPPSSNLPLTAENVRLLDPVLRRWDLMGAKEAIRQFEARKKNFRVKLIDRQRREKERERQKQQDQEQKMAKYQSRVEDSGSGNVNNVSTPSNHDEDEPEGDDEALEATKKSLTLIQQRDEQIHSRSAILKKTEEDMLCEALLEKALVLLSTSVRETDAKNATNDHRTVLGVNDRLMLTADARATVGVGCVSASAYRQRAHSRASDEGRNQHEKNNSTTRRNDSLQTNGEIRGEDGDSEIDDAFRFPNHSFANNNNNNINNSIGSGNPNNNAFHFFGKNPNAKRHTMRPPSGRSDYMFSGLSEDPPHGRGDSTTPPIFGARGEEIIENQQENSLEEQAERVHAGGGGGGQERSTAPYKSGSGGETQRTQYQQQTLGAKGAEGDRRRSASPPHLLQNTNVNQLKSAPPPSPRSHPHLPKATTELHSSFTTLAEYLLLTTVKKTFHTATLADAAAVVANGNSLLAHSSVGVSTGRDNNNNETNINNVYGLSKLELFLHTPEIAPKIVNPYAKSKGPSHEALNMESIRNAARAHVEFLATARLLHPTAAMRKWKEVSLLTANRNQSKTQQKQQKLQQRDKNGGGGEMTILLPSHLFQRQQQKRRLAALPNNAIIPTLTHHSSADLASHLLLDDLSRPPSRRNRTRENELRRFTIAASPSSSGSSPPPMITSRSTVEGNSVGRDLQNSYSSNYHQYGKIISSAGRIEDSEAVAAMASAMYVQRYLALEFLPEWLETCAEQYVTVKLKKRGSSYNNQNNSRLSASQNRQQKVGSNCEESSGEGNKSSSKRASTRSRSATRPSFFSIGDVSVREGEAKDNRNPNTRDEGGRQHRFSSAFQTRNRGREGFGSVVAFRNGSEIANENSNRGSGFGRGLSLVRNSSFKAFGSASSFSRGSAADDTTSSDDGDESAYVYDENGNAVRKNPLLKKILSIGLGKYPRVSRWYLRDRKHAEVRVSGVESKAEIEADTLKKVRRAVDAALKKANPNHRNDSKTESIKNARALRDMVFKTTEEILPTVLFLRGMRKHEKEKEEGVEAYVFSGRLALDMFGVDSDSSCSSRDLEGNHGFNNGVGAGGAGGGGSPAARSIATVSSPHRLLASTRASTSSSVNPHLLASREKERSLRVRQKLRRLRLKAERRIANGHGSLQQEHEREVEETQGSNSTLGFGARRRGGGGVGGPATTFFSGQIIQQNSSGDESDESDDGGSLKSDDSFYSFLGGRSLNREESAIGGQRNTATLPLEIKKVSSRGRSPSPANKSPVVLPLPAKGHSKKANGDDNSKSAKTMVHPAKLAVTMPATGARGKRADGLGKGKGQPDVKGQGLATCSSDAHFSAQLDSISEFDPRRAADGWPYESLEEETLRTIRKELRQRLRSERLSRLEQYINDSRTLLAKARSIEKRGTEGQTKRKAKENTSGRSDEMSDRAAEPPLGTFATLMASKDASTPNSKLVQNRRNRVTLTLIDEEDVRGEKNGRQNDSPPPSPPIRDAQGTAIVDSPSSPHLGRRSTLALVPNDLLASASPTVSPALETLPITLLDPAKSAFGTASRTSSLAAKGRSNNKEVLFGGGGATSPGARSLHSGSVSPTTSMGGGTASSSTKRRGTLAAGRRRSAVKPISISAPQTKSELNKVLAHVLEQPALVGVDLFGALGAEEVNEIDLTIGGGHGISNFPLLRATKGSQAHQPLLNSVFLASDNNIMGDLVEDFTTTTTNSVSSDLLTQPLPFPSTSSSSLVYSSPPRCPSTPHQAILFTRRDVSLLMNELRPLLARRFVNTPDTRNYKRISSPVNSVDKDTSAAAASLPSASPSSFDQMVTSEPSQFRQRMLHSPLTVNEQQGLAARLRQGLLIVGSNDRIDRLGATTQDAIGLHHNNNTYKKNESATEDWDASINNPKARRAECDGERRVVAEKNSSESFYSLEAVYRAAIGGTKDPNEMEKREGVDPSPSSRSVAPPSQNGSPRAVAGALLPAKNKKTANENDKNSLLYQMRSLVGSASEFSSQANQPKQQQSQPQIRPSAVQSGEGTTEREKMVQADPFMIIRPTLLTRSETTKEAIAELSVQPIYRNWDAEYNAMLDRIEPTPLNCVTLRSEEVVRIYAALASLVNEFKTVASTFVQSSLFTVLLVHGHCEHRGITYTLQTVPMMECASDNRFFGELTQQKLKKNGLRLDKNGDSLRVNKGRGGEQRGELKSAATSSTTATATAGSLSGGALHSVHVDPMSTEVDADFSLISASYPRKIVGNDFKALSVINDKWWSLQHPALASTETFNPFTAPFPLRPELPRERLNAFLAMLRGARWRNGSGKAKSPSTAGKLSDNNLDAEEEDEEELEELRGAAALATNLTFHREGSLAAAAVHSRRQLLGTTMANGLPLYSHMEADVNAGLATTPARNSDRGEFVAGEEESGGTNQKMRASSSMDSRGGRGIGTRRAPSPAAESSGSGNDPIGPAGLPLYMKPFARVRTPLTCSVSYLGHLVTCTATIPHSTFGNESDAHVRPHSHNNKQTTENNTFARTRQPSSSSSDQLYQNSAPRGLVLSLFSASAQVDFIAPSQVCSASSPSSALVTSSSSSVRKKGGPQDRGAEDYPLLFTKALAEVLNLSPHKVITYNAVATGTTRTSAAGHLPRDGDTTSRAHHVNAQLITFYCSSRLLFVKSTAGGVGMEGHRQRQRQRQQSYTPRLSSEGRKIAPTVKSSYRREDEECSQRDDDPAFVYLLSAGSLLPSIPPNAGYSRWSRMRPEFFLSYPEGEVPADAFVNFTPNDDPNHKNNGTGGGAGVSNITPTTHTSSLASVSYIDQGKAQLSHLKAMRRLIHKGVSDVVEYIEAVGKPLQHSELCDLCHQQGLSLSMLGRVAELLAARLSSLKEKLATFAKDVDVSKTTSSVACLSETLRVCREEMCLRAFKTYWHQIMQQEGRILQRCLEAEETADEGVVGGHTRTTGANASGEDDQEPTMDDYRRGKQPSDRVTSTMSERASDIVLRSASSELMRDAKALFNGRLKSAFALRALSPSAYAVFDSYVNNNVCGNSSSPTSARFVASTSSESAANSAPVMMGTENGRNPKHSHSDLVGGVDEELAVSIAEDEMRSQIGRGAHPHPPIKLEALEKLAENRRTLRAIRLREVAVLRAAIEDGLEGYAGGRGVEVVTPSAAVSPAHPSDAVHNRGQVSTLPPDGPGLESGVSTTPAMIEKLLALTAMTSSFGTHGHYGHHHSESQSRVRGNHSNSSADLAHYSRRTRSLSPSLLIGLGGSSRGGDPPLSSSSGAKRTMNAPTQFATATSLAEEYAYHMRCLATLLVKSLLGRESDTKAIFIWHHYITPIIRAKFKFRSSIGRSDVRIRTALPRLQQLLGMHIEEATEKDLMAEERKASSSHSVTSRRRKKSGDVTRPALTAAIPNDLAESSRRESVVGMTQVHNQQQRRSLSMAREQDDLRSRKGSLVPPLKGRANSRAPSIFGSDPTESAAKSTESGVNRKRSFVTTSNVPFLIVSSNDDEKGKVNEKGAEPASTISLLKRTRSSVSSNGAGSGGAEGSGRRGKGEDDQEFSDEDYGEDASDNESEEKGEGGVSGGAESPKRQKGTSFSSSSPSKTLPQHNSVLSKTCRATRACVVGTVTALAPVVKMPRLPSLPPLWCFLDPNTNVTSALEAIQSNSEKFVNPQTDLIDPTLFHKSLLHTENIYSSGNQRGKIEMKNKGEERVGNGAPKEEEKDKKGGGGGIDSTNDRLLSPRSLISKGATAQRDLQKTDPKEKEQKSSAEITFNSVYSIGQPYTVEHGDCLIIPAPANKSLPTFAAVATATDLSVGRQQGNGIQDENDDSRSKRADIKRNSSLIGFSSVALLKNRVTSARRGQVNEYARWDLPHSVSFSDSARGVAPYFISPSGEGVEELLRAIARDKLPLTVVLRPREDEKEREALRHSGMPDFVGRSTLGWILFNTTDDATTPPPLSARPRVIPLTTNIITAAAPTVSLVEISSSIAAILRAIGDLHFNACEGVLLKLIYKAQASRLTSAVGASELLGACLRLGLLYWVERRFPDTRRIILESIAAERAYSMKHAAKKTIAKKEDSPAGAQQRLPSEVSTRGNASASSSTPTKLSPTSAPPSMPASSSSSTDLPLMNSASLAAALRYAMMLGVLGLSDLGDAKQQGAIDALETMAMLLIVQLEALRGARGESLSEFLTRAWPKMSQESNPTRQMSEDGTEHSDNPLSSAPPRSNGKASSFFLTSNGGGGGGGGGERGSSSFSGERYKKIVDTMMRRGEGKGNGGERGRRDSFDVQSDSDDDTTTTSSPSNQTTGRSHQHHHQREDKDTIERQHKKEKENLDHVAAVLDYDIHQRIELLHKVMLTLVTAYHPQVGDVLYAHVPIANPNASTTVGAAFAPNTNTPASSMRASPAAARAVAAEQRAISELLGARAVVGHLPLPSAATMGDGRGVSVSISITRSPSVSPPSPTPHGVFDTSASLLSSSAAPLTIFAPPATHTTTLENSVATGRGASNRQQEEDDDQRVTLSGYGLGVAAAVIGCATISDVLSHPHHQVLRSNGAVNNGSNKASEPSGPPSVSQGTPSRRSARDALAVDHSLAVQCRKLVELSSSADPPPFIGNFAATKIAEENTDGSGTELNLSENENSADNDNYDQPLSFSPSSLSPPSPEELPGAQSTTRRPIPFASIPSLLFIKYLHINARYVLMNGGNIAAAITLYRRALHIASLIRGGVIRRLFVTHPNDEGQTEVSREVGKTNSNNTSNTDVKKETKNENEINTTNAVSGSQAACRETDLSLLRLVLVLIHRLDATIEGLKDAQLSLSNS